MKSRSAATDLNRNRTERSLFLSSLVLLGGRPSPVSIDHVDAEVSRNETRHALASPSLASPIFLSLILKIKSRYLTYSRAVGYP